MVEHVLNHLGRRTCRQPARHRKARVVWHASARIGWANALEQAREGARIGNRGICRLVLRECLMLSAKLGCGLRFRRAAMATGGQTKTAHGSEEDENKKQIPAWQ